MRPTTATVISRLQARYPTKAGEWGTVIEFGTIDFLAVNCWPSKGYVVHGHEIKVSRSDWLRELKNPFKNASNLRYCDHWWLVAPPGVAKMEEVPEQWGYMELTASGLRAAIKAPALRSPIPRGDRSSADFFYRESFAMMARRYAYAHADRNALFDAVDNPQPYLDAAAEVTGRATAQQRSIQADYRKKVAEMNRAYKKRRQEEGW